MTTFCIKINPYNRSSYKIYKKNKSNDTMDEFNDKYIINKFVNDTIVSFTTGIMTDISSNKSMKVSYGIIKIDKTSCITETFGDNITLYNEYLRALAKYRPEKPSGNTMYEKSSEDFENTKFILIKALNFPQGGLKKYDPKGYSCSMKFNILTSGEFIKAMLKEREICVTINGESKMMKYNLLRGVNIKFSESYGSMSDKNNILLSTFDPKVIME